MTTKKDAVLTALKNCEQWLGGAAIVETEDHDFDAIPGAYLTDISYTGCTNVIFRINDLGDLGYVDIDINEPKTLDYIVGMVLSAI